MYCNQCGCEINDTAKFCKRCGCPVEPEVSTYSETEEKAVRFYYSNRKKILTGVLAALVVLVVAGVGLIGVLGTRDATKEQPPQEILILEVKDIDLKKEYEIEENLLVIKPLHATYSDGTVLEIPEYTVYIDALEYTVEKGAVNVEGLEDGEHEVRIEWEKDGQAFSYEQTIKTKHKKDTWGKYPDVVGLTGKEISAAYGAMSAPEYGNFYEGDWGFAYVELPSIGIQMVFPAGVFGNPDDYGQSDARCLEMTSTLGNLFYNIEEEMTFEELADEMGLKSLAPSNDGGCKAVLYSGNVVYIGAGEVFDDVYTPQTSVRVTVSQEEREEIMDYFF